MKDSNKIALYFTIPLRYLYPLNQIQVLCMFWRGLKLETRISFFIIFPLVSTSLCFSPSMRHNLSLVISFGLDFSRSRVRLSLRFPRGMTTLTEQRVLPSVDRSSIRQTMAKLREMEPGLFCIFLSNRTTMHRHRRAHYTHERQYCEIYLIFSPDNFSVAHQNNYEYSVV